MTHENIDRLINDFVEAAKNSYEATLSGNSRKANIQAKRIHQVFAKITMIGDSAREALLKQVDNEDDAVASLAAAYSLKYNTEKAKAALKRISENNTGILGFGAEQALERWKEGTWQLE
jgi:plasmid maintenance system killer protein